MWSDFWSARRWRGVNEVGMGFNRHKSGVEFRIKRGMGVVTDESTEGGICGSRAATVKAIA